METVRIGIIGAGLRSGIAKYWHNPGGNSVVVAAADVSMERLKTFQEKINQHAYITTDYKELLARTDIDAVAILSPDYLHEEHAIAALQAGKHVYCEKPLAITVEGCDRIIEQAEKSGKHLMVGFNMRYMSMYQTMKEIIDSGVIGDLKAVWVRHFVGFGGYYYYHDWHGTAKNTTSLLLQKGSHDLDVIHWITGKYTKKVSAFGGLDFYGGDKPNTLTCPTCDENDTCTEASLNVLTQCAFREEIDVEDNNMLIMELEGGIKASYLQCHFTPDYSRNYTFIGTKGRVENDDVNEKVYVKTRKSNSWNELSDITYDMKKEQGSHGGADPKICRDFIELVLNNKQPLTTPYAGRMSVAVGCAATESIRSGGKVIQISQSSTVKYV
ncbi:MULTISPECIES: Gfo/Idh/MocA family protein [Bacillus cereus group]|uniref:Gfo/Idh/MocA family oxidoreductase n=1 Tax=Bacillus cereus TaxID=1396 RepID=A0AA44Q8Q1_BACCE|nr:MULTISPECIES: Gfo/Idh/MocA family oxidoreductase [Bacillus cereus group]EEL51592.1 Inositol 2-dehydrogenase [Bacillus cereus Rock3-44]PFN09060.1 gfo/Idh/MocA family oxidoreductase [Bacillus cereus]PFO78978.1 gfo/Idh/MocA family oxidoreductase [Bacillus cereus]PFR99278.1 gfo/Idh/MocA family oxidoreductase [Bacillus cereus]